MEYNVYIYFQFCRVIETTVIEEEKRKTLYGRNAHKRGGESYKPKLRLQKQNRNRPCIMASLCNKWDRITKREASLVVFIKYINEIADIFALHGKIDVEQALREYEDK